MSLKKNTGVNGEKEKVQGDPGQSWFLSWLHSHGATTLRDEELAS